MWNSTNQPTTNQIPPQPYTQAEVYNVHSSSLTTYPTIEPVQPNEGWWKRMQKNKPQSNSVGTASAIFISGGMNMAWNLGFPLISATHFELTEHIILSWFIGGIIGAFMGALACNHVPKKYILGFSSVLVTICGVLQLSHPSSYNAILVSRYLNGIAVGFIFPMTFVLVGEEVVKPLRGMNAASVDTICFNSGIFIQGIYSVSWSNEIENNFASIRMCGVLNITYGIIAFIMGSMLLIESPIYYLARGDEQRAINCLMRLQSPFTITHKTYIQLEEHKLYLAQSNQRTVLQNAIYGIPALLKLCFYRSFMALSFSYLLNIVFTLSTFATTSYETFPYILYVFFRWIGSFIASFSLDNIGRKSTMIVGFFICTSLAFTLGGIFVNTQSPQNMNIVKYILIFFQLFAAVSMTSSSAYVSEAFPLAVKPYYVSVVFLVEMLVHIIIIACKDFYIKTSFHIFYVSYIAEYFFTLGLLSLIFLGVAIFVMPETKCNSLGECLPKFRRLNNFRN